MINAAGRTNTRQDMRTSSDRFLYRSPFWSTTEGEECERALAHLEQLINFEGPNTIAAILLESVIGSV